MNRRHLLTALPAVAALPAAAASPVLASDTPVARLYHEWQVYRAWLNTPEATSMPEKEFDDAVDLGQTYLECIVATPSLTAQDAAIKMLAVVDDYDALNGCPFQQVLFEEAKAWLPV